MKEKTILFVEDNDFERKLLVGAVCQKIGCQALEAASAEQCLEILDQTKIDLVLMDIMMPGELGSQVLKKIRERFNAIDLPIIMVTSKGDVGDIVGCLHSGANDYITKPVNFEVAVSRLLTHMRLAELSKETSRLREIAAIDAMITTYNHEINNPLTIALGSLKTLDSDAPKSRERLEAALWRIADIVKSIRTLSEKKELEFQEYASTNKKVKLG